MKSYLCSEDVLSSARWGGRSPPCLGVLQAGFMANAGLCQELLGMFWCNSPHLEDDTICTISSHLGSISVVVEGLKAAC